MIATLTLCGALLAGGGFWTPEAPSVEEHSFVLPMGEMEQGSLEKARMHRATNRKIVVFVPGLRAKRMVRKYKEGPIKTMRVKRLKRGSTISLFTRGSAREVFKNLKLETRTNKALSINMLEEEPRSAINTVAQKAAAVADVVAGEVASKNQAKVNEEKPRLATGSSAMAASGFFGLIIAALSMILWFLKSNKKIDILDDSIDVVAVKPFGGKHKLALIETCGEKLLLAASEKGVTLLSHVGNHLVPEQQDQAGAGAFAGFSMPDLNPVPRAEPQMAHDEVIPVPSDTTEAASRPLSRELPKLESDDSLKMATAKINSGSLSKDLEGLVKLREKRTTKSKKAANGLAGHLANRYRSAGAAA
jgi:hypothetical protein